MLNIQLYNYIWKPPSEPDVYFSNAQLTFFESWTADLSWSNSYSCHSNDLKIGSKGFSDQRNLFPL